MGGHSTFVLLNLAAFAALCCAFNSVNVHTNTILKSMDLCRSSLCSMNRICLQPTLRKSRIAAFSYSMNADTARDELINKLAAAAPYELPSLVSQNLKEISQPALFLRLAALNDEAEDQEKKQKYAALADNLVATLEAVVKRTEERLDSSSALIQEILSRAAEPDGQFIVPLKPDRTAAMRAHISKNLEHIDDGFLSTVFAYMKKADNDGLDGLVVILQKLLQLWAAADLISAGCPSAAVVKLLNTDPEDWDAILRAEIGGSDAGTDKDVLAAAVQSCVEKVVLQKASGSHAQRVEAEFLRELMARIRSVGSAAEPSA